MQKKVTFVSLSHSPIGFNMVYNLKYYVDTDASPPDIDVDKSVVVKGSITDMTPDQLVNRELPKMAELMQEEIKNFKKVRAALAAVDFAGKESLLEDGLNG